VIDAAQESPVSCHGSRGFPFEFAMAPFRKAVAIGKHASMPRRQINLRQVQNMAIAGHKLLTKLTVLTQKRPWTQSSPRD
jgi:hypothetical protein